MSELESREAEASSLCSAPLLPIEKKLIAWSLGIGVAPLIVLAVVNRLLGA
jgi:hypothetical protein